MIGLREFLRDLAIDPSRMALFLREPQTIMNAVGLDERGRRTLYSGSAEAMWDLMRGEPENPNLMPSTVHVVDRPPSGSLVVVGTGIRSVGQMTVEAIAHISTAEVVFHLIADPIGEEAIKLLNPVGAVPLRKHYGEGIHRGESYEAMVQEIVGAVKAGKRACVALYGHPGVFAFPAHEAIRRLKGEGYIARMLPAVSAEDCLFSDLGVDPAVKGCQSFEATDFLLYDRAADTSSQLVLWQVGVVGDVTFRSAGYQLGAFPLLVARLCQLYGGGHVVTIYEASVLPALAPKIIRVALGDLTPALVTASSTLYIPPVRASVKNPDLAAALGL